MRRPQPPDLRHHRLALARLDVRDVHLDAAGQLRQLVPSAAGHRWRLMRASWRSSSLNAVSMTRCATFMRAQPLPQRRVRPGVAGEDPRAGGGSPCSTAKPTAGTVWAAVSTSMRLPLSSSTSPRAKGTSSRIGSLGAGQAGEIGPDHAVEDVGAQRGDGLGQRVHLDRRRAGAPRAGASRRRRAGRSRARGRGGSG